jgi:FixJ family two-component response regulator
MASDRQGPTLIAVTQRIDAIMVDDNLADFTLLHEACAACQAPLDVRHYLDPHHFLDEAINGTLARPGLLILDVNMPRLNGIETLDIIVESWPEVPVVMYTSANPAASEDDAIDHGAIGFFEKPHLFEEALLVVPRLVAFARQRRDASGTRPARRRE